MESAPEETAWCPQNIQWIKECLQKKLGSSDSQKGHEENLQNSPFLPSRLLDVMPDGKYDCRLVIADEGSISLDTRYMALSYCWGSDKDAETHFKTEADTISDRKRGFMDESTPSCIRDAFKVARTLGIRYLWIDVLCIIQGDLKDWERQSAQMANVYRGAFAVICAAASESCHQGFLERNKHSACVKFRSKINPAINGHYNIRWHSTISKALYGGSDTDDQDRCNSRWATRGWTFQESCLAVRAIIFGRTKLHYTSGVELLWTENEEPCINLKERKYTRESFESLDNRYMSGWLEQIQSFTSRQYSDPRDKLPALSGLAVLASHGNPENYLAGVRKPQLHRDLMWINCHRGNDKTSVLLSLQSPNPYVAPSWSWASRQQGALMTYPGLNDQLHLGQPTDVSKEYSRVEAQISRTGHNPYGRVSQCRLIITAVTVRLLQDLQPGYNRHFRYEYYDRELFARVITDWHSSQESDGLLFLLLGSLHPQLDEVESDNESSADSQTDQGKVQKDANEGGEDDDDVENDKVSASEYPKDTCEGRIAFGIIILPALEAGEFYRVGVWSAAERDGKGGLYYFRDYQESTVTLI